MKALLAIGLAAGAFYVYEKSKPRGASYGNSDLVRDLAESVVSSGPSTFGDTTVTDDERRWCESLPSVEAMKESIVQDVGYPGALWFCQSNPNDPRCRVIAGHNTCLDETGREYLSKFRSLPEIAVDAVGSVVGGVVSGALGGVMWLAIGGAILYVAVHK